MCVCICVGRVAFGCAWECVYDYLGFVCLCVLWGACVFMYLYVGMLSCVCVCACVLGEGERTHGCSQCSLGSFLALIFQKSALNFATGAGLEGSGEGLTPRPGWTHSGLVPLGKGEVCGDSVLPHTCPVSKRVSSSGVWDQQELCPRDLADSFLGSLHQSRDPRDSTSYGPELL